MGVTLEEYVGPDPLELVSYVPLAGEKFHKAGHFNTLSRKTWTSTSQALLEGYHPCATCYDVWERNDLIDLKQELLTSINKETSEMSRRDVLTAEIDAALAAAARKQAELDAIESMPEDEYEPGVVVTWRRRFDEDGETYDYAAIKFRANAYADSWAVTGRTTRYYSWEQLWEQLLSKAVPGTLAWCSETTEIPT